MSNNQPPPPPRRPQPDPRSRPGRRDGRGREGGGEDCSAYSKKVQPTTLGDAFEANSRKNSRSRAQPIRAGIPDNQPWVAANSSSPSSSSSSGSQPRAGALRFTPPREPELTLQPTTSSDSNRRMPSNQSVNGAVSSARKLSYMAVVKNGEKKTREEHENLLTALVLFLDNYTEDGQVHPFYQAELLAMQLRSPHCLTIQFRHMCKHDAKLAFETWKSLCNSSKQEWILPALQIFLRRHSQGSEADIMRCDLKLADSPSSMKKVTDVLRTATYGVNLLGGECRVCEARAGAKLVIQLFFREVFTRHEEGLSWGGDFKVGDMFLINNADLHIMKPCVPVTGPGRLKDIQKGGVELLPYFKGFDGYPAYFKQLEQDIQQVDTRQITQPWCVEYFKFHMASLPSMTRRNFELALHFVSKSIAIELDGIFGRLTSDLVKDWQVYIEKSECEVLKDVLDYIDPATGEKVKYANNIGGLIKYKRHFLEHAFGPLSDINEIELFGAKKFSEHLPGAVKLLLEHNKMEKCFATAWSSLKSSCRDGRNTPAKQ